MHKMSTPSITESELRQAVRSRLLADATKSGGRLFEELGIEGGEARVDLALVDTQLSAFELKSDLDSFARLHNQIHAYNRVFDRVTLVTGPIYSEASLALMPTWWGVWSAARRVDGTLALRVLRKPKANPIQDRLSMAMLLWRAECIEALASHRGELPPKRATKFELQEMLARELSVRTLREAVTSFLRKRQAGFLPSTSLTSDGTSDAVAFALSCLA
jgi:hypothetical protein